MTHPPPGPSTPTPPPAPRPSAIPLTPEQRADNYRRQTGQSEPTPRQRRRIKHKVNKNA